MAEVATKPRTPAQLANDARLRAAAEARRAGLSTESAVAVQDAPNPSLVSAEQVFLAESVSKQETVVSALNTSDTIASEGIGKKRSQVTHITDGKVRMWKPTDAGYRPRWVPGSQSLIMMNLKEGWKTTCPDCGTDCGDDPNDCPAHEPAKVVYCPKAGCTHKINLRNLALNFQPDIAKNDPNAVDLGYGQADELAMLKAAMDTHILTRHPREALILLGVRHPDRQRETVQTY